MQPMQMPRRSIAIVIGAALAVGAVVWWIAASGSESQARLQQPAASHVDQLEQAAEAADKAGGTVHPETP
jgi:hypothetical protein